MVKMPVSMARKVSMVKTVVAMVKMPVVMARKGLYG
jgi:hypothetical protein